MAEALAKLEDTEPPKPLDTREVKPENSQPRVTAATAASEPEADVEMAEPAPPVAAEGEAN